jgi:hypothetical protein
MTQKEAFDLFLDWARKKKLELTERELSLVIMGIRKALGISIVREGGTIKQIDV